MLKTHNLTVWRYDFHTVANTAHGTTTCKIHSGQSKVGLLNHELIPDAMFLASFSALRLREPDVQEAPQNVTGHPLPPSAASKA